VIPTHAALRRSSHVKTPNKKITGSVRLGKRYAIRMDAWFAEEEFLPSRERGEEANDKINELNKNKHNKAALASRVS
jgi:hypothetical protein